MKMNCPWAAERAKRIQPSIPRAAPMSGMMPWATAIDKARIRAK